MQKRPTTRPSGFISSPIVRGVGRRASSAHAQTQTAIFATSDGCTLIGPSRNQRRAPLIGGATTSTAMQSTSDADEQHRRERPQPVVVEARRRGRAATQADERVRALLDEERHRVAGAERRRRRRGAEHHHETERDEPERDEDEEALLELSAGSPVPIVHPWSFCTSFPNSSPRCS